MRLINLLIIVIAFTNCSTTKKSNAAMEQKPIFEIAIRKVKQSKEKEFRAARSAFIKKLKEQDGIEKDWEFKSFFTMPEPDETDVFVGMTRYESPEAMQKIAGQLMQSQEAANFFSTFDMKSFVAVQPEDGSYFKLEDHIKDGNVLEVAVRSPKAGMESKFSEARKGFFGLVAQQDGYLFDKEFVDLQSGDKVVLIGWESMEAFQKALGVLQTKPEMGTFFGMLDVKAYQALMHSSNE